MKGARLFVDRKEELQRHLESEKEPKVRLKLVFLNAFSRFAPQLEELCQAFGIATSRATGGYGRGIGKAIPVSGKRASARAVRRSSMSGTSPT